MKLLLFGGTFDPPHNGHMNGLRAAIRLVQPDRAIVMPAGTPPHKQASATPPALRLAMCACFRAVAPCVQVSDWELRRPGPSYTVHTLAMLRRRCPQAQLYLCIGGDMLQCFTRWYHWQDILRLATLVVQSRRPGEGDGLAACAAALEGCGGRVLFTGAEPLLCASRDIRAGTAGDGLLPAPVPAIITHSGLYGKEADHDV